LAVDDEARPLQWVVVTVRPREPAGRRCVLVTRAREPGLGGGDPLVRSAERRLRTLPNLERDARRRDRRADARLLAEDREASCPATHVGVVRRVGRRRPAKMLEEVHAHVRARMERLPYGAKPD